MELPRLYQGTVNLILTYANNTKITLQKPPKNYNELEIMTDTETKKKGVIWEYYYFVQFSESKVKIEIMNDNTLKKAYEDNQEQLDINVSYDISTFTIQSPIKQPAQINLTYQNQQQTIQLAPDFKQLRSAIRAKFNISQHEDSINIIITKNDNSTVILISDLQYQDIKSNLYLYLDQSHKINCTAIILEDKVSSNLQPFSELSNQGNSQFAQQVNYNQKTYIRNPTKPNFVIQLEEAFQKQFSQLKQEFINLNSTLQRLEDLQVNQVQQFQNRNNQFQIEELSQSILQVIEEKIKQPELQAKIWKVIKEKKDLYPDMQSNIKIDIQNLSQQDMKPNEIIIKTKQNSQINIVVNNTISSKQNISITYQLPPFTINQENATQDIINTELDFFVEKDGKQISDSFNRSIQIKNPQVRMLGCQKPQTILPGQVFQMQFSFQNLSSYPLQNFFFISIENQKIRFNFNNINPMQLFDFSIPIKAAQTPGEQRCT